VRRSSSSKGTGAGVQSLTRAPGPQPTSGAMV
jgi:hypothetical protein